MCHGFFDADSGEADSRKTRDADEHVMHALESLLNLHPEVQLAASEELGRVDLGVQPQSMALMKSAAY
jgi:hypothetical protein